MNVTRGCQSTDSVKRLTAPTPTNERTDRLTESIQPCVEILGFRNARAHIRGFISRLALVRALADAEAEAAS